MGSKADTHVTDTGLMEQEPESASGAKTTPSDGSGGADDSGASSPSSHRHQEEVQKKLKDRCGVMDVPMGPDDNLFDEKKALVKEPEITSVASMRSGRADPAPSDNSGGGDGIGAPFRWTLTQKQHVRNLKKNCKHAFGYRLSPEWKWKPIKEHPWFEKVVAKIRADPFLDNSEVESMEAPSKLKLEGARLLHLAVLMGDFAMVKKILEIPLPLNKVYIDSHIKGPWTPYSALDLAIVGGQSEMVDALLQKKAKVNTGKRGSLQLAVVFARAGQTENTSKIIQLLVKYNIDVRSKDRHKYTAFYLAVAKGKTDIVKELLKLEDKIQLNEKCRRGRPLIQIAHEEDFEEIESALMQRDDVKRFIESQFRDRQAYVDAANAILVGAALIAGVTFASWLQPPLNYTTSYHGSSVEYVDVEHNLALGCFWVFNTLSFYFAIGTVVFGAHSVLPRRHLFITENVNNLSQNLVLTSILLAISMLFVVVAGFIVLTPVLRYRWFMIAPMILGGIMCIGSVGYIFKSLWENSP